MNPRRTSRRHGTSDPDGCPDRGSVSLYIVVVALGLLAAAGLVLDGGAAFAARGAAATAAQQAARAGADALDPVSLRAGTPAGLTVNAAAARAAANRVLAAAGATGTVTARVTGRTHVLSAVGVDELGGTGTFTAVPLHGTTTGSG